MSVQTARAGRFQRKVEWVPLTQGESRAVAADFTAVICAGEIAQAWWTVGNAALVAVSAPAIEDNRRTARVNLEARSPGISRLWCKVETATGEVRVQEFVIEVSCDSSGETVTVSA